MQTAYVDALRDTHARFVPFAAANTIVAGDMVFEDPSNAGHGKSIVSVGYKADLAKTQRVAAMRFLGIAIGNKPDATAALDVPVAKRGIFEMVAASSTYEVGDLVAVDDNAGGTALIQQVIKTTDPQLAIGKIVRREASATTTVLVELLDRQFDEFTIREAVSGTSEIKVFDSDAPFKFEILDFHIICTDANAGTVKLTDGTNDITNALTHGTSDKALVAVGTIDDAYNAIAKNGKLSIVPATGGTSIAVIRCKRSA